MHPQSKFKSKMCIYVDEYDEKLINEIVKGMNLKSKTEAIRFALKFTYMYLVLAKGDKQ